VDETIIFHHLTKEDLKQVIELELTKVRERLGERGLKLILSDEAKTYLIGKASSTKDGQQGLDFGARPLRRAIENYIEDPLSEELLKGEFQGKDTITVGVKVVGEAKQLVFEGSATQGEPVGAGAGASEKPAE
jgi:ATP-dependent Clp protease ATP-binding subunit ClpC